MPAQADILQDGCSKKNQKSSSIMHAEVDTALLAKIDAVSNIAIFALQACGLGGIAGSQRW
jgi:hypothetical protein